MVFHDLGNLGFADVGKVLILRLRIPWEEFNQRFSANLKDLSPKSFELLRRACVDSQDPPILVEESELDGFFQKLQPFTARIPPGINQLKSRKKESYDVEIPGIRNVKSFVLKDTPLSPPPEPKKPRYVRISHLYSTLIEDLYGFTRISWNQLDKKGQEEKLAYLSSNITRTQKLLVEIHALAREQVEDFWRQVLDVFAKLLVKIEQPWRQPLIDILSLTLPAGIVPIYCLAIAEGIFNNRKPYARESWAFQELAGTNYRPDELETIFEDIAFKQYLFIVSARVAPTRTKQGLSPEKWTITVVNRRWLAHTINERKDFKYKVIGQELPYSTFETSFRPVNHRQTYQSILTTLSQLRLLSKPIDFTETGIIIIGKPYVTMTSTLRIIVGIIAGVLSIYISLSRIIALNAP